MAAGKITAAALEKLPAGRVLWDREIRGFGARRQTAARKQPDGTTKGGAVSFILKARLPTGRQVLLTIGPWGRGDYGIDDARAVATRWRLMLREGKDPREEKAERRIEPMTVSELCDSYMQDVPTLLLGRQRRPKKASTLATDASRIEAHVKPLLGKLSVAAVTSGDVETFMRRVASGETQKERTGGRGQPARGGKGAASRTVGMLGAIFTYAIKKGLRADNPVRGVVRYADGRRDRRLSGDEYKALASALAAVAESQPVAVAAIRFLALTGWRRGEAVNLRWSDIDRERRTVTLGDTKTGRSIRPLSHAALAVLATVPKIAGNPYVFPAAHAGKPLASLSRVFARVRAKARLGADLTPHVLRHSYASLASDAGLSEATIAALLGHRLGTITARYTHTADAVLLAAADMVANMVTDLMEGRRPSAAVVPLIPKIGAR